MKKSKFLYTLLLVGILFGLSIPVYADQTDEAVRKDASHYEVMSGEQSEEMNDPLYYRYMSSYKSSNRKNTEPGGITEITHAERFKDYAVIHGIDVSKWQAEINWPRVKEAGVKYAMIRLGYRGSANGTLQMDSRFDENMNGAKNAGIPIGIYFFTQAVTVQEAEEEAQFVIDNLRKYAGWVELPVVIDIENLSDSRLDAANLSAEEKTAICKAFCEKIESAGYAAGVYSNKSYMYDDLNMRSLEDEYFIWMANYTMATDYRGKYSMWQYTSKGSVDGIEGYVDLNVMYLKEWNGQEFRFSGLYPLSNGEWALYKNGEIATGYTGLYNDAKEGWWLVVNGKVDFSYNDLWNDPAYGWWKVTNGAVDFAYNDLYGSPVYGWWKITNGAVDFAYNDLYGSPIYGWWKVTNGAVDFNYNDLFGSPMYGWWKVSGGAVDFSFTGLYESPVYGWWLIGSGAVWFDYNDLWNDPVHGWWKVANGTVDSAYTGLYESPTFGNWMILSGAVVF